MVTENRKHLHSFGRLKVFQLVDETFRIACVHWQIPKMPSVKEGGVASLYHVEAHQLENRELGDI